MRPPECALVVDAHLPGLPREVAAVRATSYRLPEDLVSRIKEASALAGLSATEYVRRAIEARLEAPSILEQPMVSRETCAHPFRFESKCTVCGEQL